MKKQTKFPFILLAVLMVSLLLPGLSVMAQADLNPLTGLPAAQPDRLGYPPFLIPVSRYPDVNRPSMGLSAAPWVFELYVNAGESRPYGLFYGELPRAAADIVPVIGAISSAVPGVESLRKQYQAVLVTTGNSEFVLEEGLLNLENWYGEKGNEKYPDLPLQRLEAMMEKWRGRLAAPDLEGIKIPFELALPANGIAGKALTVRYASFNEILWEFDPTLGQYLRSQNSNADPTHQKDMDALTNQQIAAQNVIILFADHSMMADAIHFTVNFNFVERNPAIIFRDGVRYDVFWTTKSESYERETEKMRPIRFITADGEPFPLKPGKSWVHVFQPGNDNYEVEALGSNLKSAGSGIWKFPYISVKPEEKTFSDQP